MSVCPHVSNEILQYSSTEDIISMET